MSLEMNTLSILDQAVLTAISTDFYNPSLQLRVNNTFSVLPGGLVTCKWLVVTAGNINIKSSGILTAEGGGNKPMKGKGFSSGIPKYAKIIFSLFISNLF